MAKNSGNEIGTAYISILPSLKGFEKEVERQLSRETPSNSAIKLKAALDKSSVFNVGKIASKQFERAATLNKAKLGVDHHHARSDAKKAGHEAGTSYIQGWKESGAAGVIKAMGANISHGTREILSGKNALEGVASLAGPLAATAMAAEGFHKVFDFGKENYQEQENFANAIKGVASNATQAKQLIDQATQASIKYGLSMESLQGITTQAASTGESRAAFDSDLKMAAIYSHLNPEQAPRMLKDLEEYKNKGVLDKKFFNTDAAMFSNAKGVIMKEKGWDKLKNGNEIFEKELKAGHIKTDDYIKGEESDTAGYGRMLKGGTDTLSGQSRQLKAQLGLIMGKLFAPIGKLMTKIFSKINPLLAKFQGWMSKISQSAGFKKLTDDLKTMWRSLAPIGHGIMAVARYIAKLSAEMLKLQFKRVAGYIHSLTEWLSEGKRQFLNIAHAVHPLTSALHPLISALFRTRSAGHSLGVLRTVFNSIGRVGHWLSGVINKLCQVLGVSVPEGSGTAGKAMALMGHAFSVASNAVITTLEIMKSAVFGIFDAIVNKIVDVSNTIGSVFNKISGIGSKFGIHIGHMDALQHVNHHAKSAAQILNDYKTRAADNASFAQSQTDMADAEKWNQGFKNAHAKHAKKATAAIQKATTGAGMDTPPSSEGSGGGSGGGHAGKTGKAIHNAVTSVRAQMMQQLIKLFDQEKQYEKTHQGKHNAKLEQAMKKIIDELKKSSKTLNGVHSSTKAIGATGRKSLDTRERQSESGREVGEKMADLGKTAVADNTEGTPFSNPLEWKNVKSLENLLGGMSNAFSGGEGIFGGIGKSLQKKAGKAAFDDHATESPGLKAARFGSNFSGSSGVAGALSKKAGKPSGKASMAKGFHPMKGSPKGAPASIDPFTQWGGGNGSGTGLLNGLKDMTNLKNFISRDATDKMGMTTPDAEHGGEKGVAGKPGGGSQTVQYNFNGNVKDPHAVQQKIHREHNVQRARTQMHSMRSH